MFYHKGAETLAQVAQRGGGCPLLEMFKVRLDGALSNLIHLKMFLLIADRLD